MDSPIIISSESEDDELFEKETDSLIALMPQLYCKEFCLAVVRMYHIRGSEFEHRDIKDISRAEIYPLACEAVAGLARQIRVLQRKLNRRGRLKQKERPGDDIKLFFKLQDLQKSFDSLKSEFVNLQDENKELRRENDKLSRRDASPKRKNR